jgi:hypothetical protein
MTFAADLESPPRGLGLSRRNGPDGERQTIHLPKPMITVVWNPSGFHVVKSLAEGTKFSAQYYVNNILIGISDW